MYKETAPAKIQDQANEVMDKAPGLSNGISTTSSGKSKINMICDGFLAVLADRMPKHLQNLVTAYVSKSPPDIDAGLTAIAKLQGKVRSVSNAWSPMLNNFSRLARHGGRSN